MGHFCWRPVPVNANDSTTVSFNNFSVKPAFNDKQLYIVAFASDATTRSASGRAGEVEEVIIHLI